MTSADTENQRTGRMHDYGLSVRQLAKAAGVTEHTVRRWKRRGGIPEPYSSALQARLSSDTGLASPAWVGWHFQNDTLVSPEGVIHTPGEIRASRLQHRVIEEYRREIGRRQAEAHMARDLYRRADDLLIALDALVNAAEQLRDSIPGTGYVRKQRRQQPQPPPLQLAPAAAHRASQHARRRTNPIEALRLKSS